MTPVTGLVGGPDGALRQFLIFFMDGSMNLGQQIL